VTRFGLKDFEGLTGGVRERKEKERHIASGYEGGSTGWNLQANTEKKV